MYWAKNFVDFSVITASHFIEIKINKLNVTKYKWISVYNKPENHILAFNLKKIIFLFQIINYYKYMKNLQIQKKANFKKGV